MTWFKKVGKKSTMMTNASDAMPGLSHAERRQQLDKVIRFRLKNGSRVVQSSDKLGTQMSQTERAVRDAQAKLRMEAAFEEKKDA